ncbi:hypothetical protein VPH35_054664 [Triticum aestivum]|uniref:Uncharacterized protein n=1 Tax=Triticum aestivum TaxID=4565 RepID=A0A077S6Q4_WHEAT|nr:uncharacterized protein LOC123066149 [Triticum aestivum]CDM85574.1 unnamed protein product [Triticum aestivum]
MERGRAMPRGRRGRGRGRGRGRARTPVADGGNRGEASKAGLANKAKELAGAGQEDANGEAHDWVEVPVVWRQPRGAADDDDAARMKQLVEDPKEKTAAADDAAARMEQAVEKPVPTAPFDPGLIEHINVGGYVMERDAYDFIRYDLGMPPPSLEPEPRRLWSWDDSSFPRARRRHRHRRPSEPPTSLCWP